MQTLPLLILLGWSIRSKVYPSIWSRSSGVEQSMYISDKHMKSCLYIEIYAFNCVNFDKLRVNLNLVFLDLGLVYKFC